MTTYNISTEELIDILTDIIMEDLFGVKTPKNKNQNNEHHKNKCKQCHNCSEKTNNTKTATETTPKDKIARRVQKYPIKEVKFFDKATVVFWKDNTKTVAVCRDDDTFNPWTGLSIAICKKLMGSQAFHDVFKTYIPKEHQPKNKVTKNKNNA